MSDAEQAALLRDLANKNSMSTEEALELCLANSTQQAVTAGTAGGTLCVADP